MPGFCQSKRKYNIFNNFHIQNVSLLFTDLFAKNIIKYICI